MILDTRRSTGIIIAARCLTIGIVLRADVVWESLGVLGGIGSKAVGTDAAVGKGRRVTRVRHGAG
jgi:hypothetical protein